MLPEHYKRLLDRLTEAEIDTIWINWTDELSLGVGQPTRLFVDVVSRLYPHWSRIYASNITSALLRHFLEPGVSDLTRFRQGSYGWSYDIHA
jgi:hypothetical protein